MPNLHLSADELHLTHADLEETGIQEKYLRSHLCPNEALTELDVRRFIASTGMQAQIQVVNLADSDAIKVALVDLPITLMLNIAGAGETPEWASVVVKADTIEVHAHQAQEKIKQAIESVLPPDINPTFLNEPLDNTSDGYKALHALYTHEVNQQYVATLPDAFKFSLMADEQDIVKFVYRTELNGIVLSEAVRSALPPEAAQQFGADGHIRVLHLEALINLMDENNVKGAVPSSLVIEQIGSLNIYSKDLFFPSAVPASPLSSTDYYHFLTLLHEKCKDEDAVHPIKNLTLFCVDTKAFEGLIAYVETHHKVPFETLTLDITALDLKPPNGERSLLYLKSVLLAVSKTNLKAIKLLHVINEEERVVFDGVVENLGDFITSRAVAVDVCLPETLTEPGERKGFDVIQEKIDAVTAERIRDKNIRQFNQDKSDERAEVLVKRAIRKRPKLAKSNINVDIELEQEQEAELHSETAIEVEKAADNFETEGIEFYDFLVFTEALDAPFSLTSHYLQEKPENLRKNLALWSQWFGLVGDTEVLQKTAPKLSAAAMLFLLDHQEQFQYGLDLKRLPPGFILKEDEFECLIHYDEQLALLSDYDPLSVQVREALEQEVPTPKQFERWLEVLGEQHELVQKWHQLKQSPYNRMEERVFKSTFPDALENDVERRRLLDALIIDSPALELKIKALFEAVDDLSVGALLQLYLKYGEPGIDALKEEIDADKHLFKQLNTAIYKKTNSYVPLFDEASKEAIKVIQGLTEGERVWFDTLLAQHGEAQSNVCLVDLVNAFKAFKKELEAFETEGNQPLKLSSQCLYSDVKSMPTALSRILSLLKHVSKKDKYAQWCEISPLDSEEIPPHPEVSCLDLSADGMIRAISEDDGINQWAFITRDMRMSMDHIKNRYGDIELKYRQSIYRYTNGVVDEEHDDRDYKYFKEKPRSKFFRSVAFQERNGQLPLDFYQYVDDKIQKSGLADCIKTGLYSVMSKVLSGRENVLLMGDIEAVKAEFDETLRLTVQGQSMSIVPALIREPLWGRMFELLPGFPPTILNHFLSFYLARINNPLFLPLLMKAAVGTMAGQNPDNSFHMQIAILITEFSDAGGNYGASCFEGMKDYERVDYEKESGKHNIFLKFTNIIKHLDLAFGRAEIDSRTGGIALGRRKKENKTFKVDGSRRDQKKAYKELYNKNAYRDPKRIIRLISTFKLASADMAKLKVVMDQYPSDERLGEGFDILRHTSLKHGKRAGVLHCDDLLFILEVVMDSNEPVVEVMKTLKLKNGSKISGYFEKDFLDEYSRPGVSDELILKLSETFNEVQVEEIKKMLLQFKSPGDHIEYGKIVSKLVLIGKDLSVIDKTVFIQKLTASPDFYKDVSPLSDDSHPFVELLDQIHRKEAVDTFVGFMGALRTFKQKTKTKTTEGLTERALLYIGTLLPALKFMEDRVISEVELLPVVRDMLFRTPVAELESETYIKDFQAVLVCLNTIASDNPTAKRALLKLFMGHLGDYSVESGEGLLEHVARLANKLQDKFKAIEDKNTVLSLCLHFNKAKARDTHGLTPDGLLALFDEIDTVDEVFQQSVLKVAVALLNSNKGYTLDDFKAFLVLVKEDADFLAFTTRVYKKAPFPDLKTLLAWHKAAEAGTTSLEDAYQAFDIAPCHRELFSGKPPMPLNGFHLKKAKSQLAKMQGLEAKIDLKRCQEMTDWARGVSSDELLAQFAMFNPNHPEFDAAKEVDYEALVALVAELLYRSKGRDVRGSNGQFELGSSMEINTTQYLAILSLLKTPGHVTSQIGTGEGKSRIMMIANVCQYAQGKTVDFVTRDVQLAQRDFVEFQPFFDMVGAKTSLIFADSDPSMYQKHGINFSDPSSLNLFRNKAASLGQHPLVIDEDESNRALLLDEADKTYFDMAGTRFNFSRESDASIRDMRWVYPLMMSYFSEEKVVLRSDSSEKKTITPTDLYYENVDLSRETFLNFARANCSKAELHRLKSVSEAQIEQWQTAAVTANELDYQKDFVIEPNTAIRTPRGVKISSEARLLFSSRVSRDSKFSFGVHQCLHARLNRARETLHPEDDSPLGDVLRTCDTSFYVQDEKQIVYSSTSKNMTDDYKKGSLKAVTGTSGSLMERAEAREVYGRCDDTPMTFIDVPKDKAMQRVDRALRLTRNKSQQITVLVDLIKKARAKNQPILIVAENDEESAAIYKALNKTYFKSDKAIQRIHSQMSLDDERAAINEAGKAGQITVSTEMVGRGTDIVLKGEAKKHGLSVMGTYLPRERDLKQIIGRSGRFGAKGDTRLVLDKVRLRQRIGKRTLGRGGFYYNAEAYIRREQALMDRKRQCERLIKNTVGDFRKSITDNFFDELFPTADKAQQKELLSIWSGFFDKTDKAWNETWPHIQALLLKKEISVSQVQKLLDGYATEVQQRWDAARSQIQRQPIAGKEVLHAAVPRLALDKHTKTLLSDFVLKEQAPSERRVYDHYDSAHDGRYVHYTHWSIPLKASLKGWANLIPFVNFDDARRPFANTRAWFAGHGQLFPWLRVGQHDAGIMGLLLLGVLGAVAGVALSLTGVLAPLGLFLFGQTAAWVTAGLFGFMGFSAGAVLGVSVGSLVDYAREKPSDKEEAVNFGEVAEVQSVNQSSEKKTPSKSASKTPNKPNSSEPRVNKPGFFKDPNASGQAPEEPGNTPPTQSGPGQSGDGG